MSRFRWLILATVCALVALAASYLAAWATVVHLEAWWSFPTVMWSMAVTAAGLGSCVRCVYVALRDSFSRRH
jgi:hypothetical protein